jgi:lipopolysaccharide transport system ATP-binding protein
MAPVISVERLSKVYRLGLIGGGTLTDDLSRWWAKVRNKPDPLTKIGQEQSTTGRGGTFLALSDVSFDVEQGQVLGIVGRNGAGKSTLLKILSQITGPTRGRVSIRGRVASLLEVGTGFHAELSGRENIFLNGAILGMTKAEIRRKFDEIVDFSGIEPFIDTPVKRYSSGMYVRLAFAVAAHLEPEILIVDEVLAVGDAAFQKKCLGQMERTAKGGRTVLFVSHNSQAVTALCTRAILLEHGQLVEAGSPRTIIDHYLRTVQASAERMVDRTWRSADEAPGNDHIRVRRIAIVPAEGGAQNGVDMETPFRVEVEYWNLAPGARIIVNLAFYAFDGSPAFETFSLGEHRWDGVARPAGLFRSVCCVPANLMNQGEYRIRVVFLDPDAVTLFDLHDGAVLTVHNRGDAKMPWFGRFIGHLHPRLAWSTELIHRGHPVDRVSAGVGDALLEAL